MTSQRWKCVEMVNNGAATNSQQHNGSISCISKFIRKRTTVKCSFYYLYLVLLLVALIVCDISEAATTTGRKSVGGGTNLRTTSQTAQQGRKVMHPAFANAGQKAGLQIWRVQNFDPVPVDPKDYGKFYEGDSYIVLYTKEQRGQLSWNIHFWLGRETSQDESGSAAILSVELDDQLGGAPIQYREVQEHESQLFLSYFKDKGGIRYLKGGTPSGFKHVDPNAPQEKKLFQVKGKRNARVRQVEPSVSSMNKGDCFILDTTRTIYVYMGEKAKRIEKLTAVQAANHIRDQDHAGRSKVVIIDENSSDDERAKFFQELGSGTAGNIPDESVGGDDEAYEKKDEGVALYRVSDASGTMKLDQITDKPLKQASLNTNDCFFLDTGSAGIYAWIGKKCNDNERKTVMSKATEYLKNKKYPAWTSVKRIVEFAEPTAFKQYFSEWRDRGEIHSRILKRSVNMDDENERRLLKFLQKSGGKAQSFMPDNGDGSVKIYRVENFELVPVDQATYGIFFEGDSYVIKYSYMSERGQRYIIYFWQGEKSSQDEKASSAIHAMRLGNELRGKAIQIRVTQNNEPKHFLQIFKGKMITLMGGKASGFKNVQDRDTYDEDGTRLFRVRGVSDETVRTMQVPEVASSLNSDDVFILEMPRKTFIWEGSGSNEYERSKAVQVAKRLTPSHTLVSIDEGAEPEEFWNALGGKGEYEHEYVNHSDENEPRLFHCHISKLGRLKVEEIKHFTQEDLDEDDIMILDTSDEIYVWVGNGASKEEKEKIIPIVKKYLKKNSSERNRENDVLIIIKQGEEPQSFKELFPSWDYRMWETQMTYDDMKQRIQDINNEIED